MLKHLKTKAYTYYLKTVNAIAFIPTIIAFIFFIMVIVLIQVDQTFTIKSLIFKIPLLKIESIPTARTILATIIGGTFSLTIFSFSMVMVVLNQASSNYSPKLLGGLVGKKSNQFILGVYLGSIVYNLILLMQIGGENKTYELPHLSIVIGIIISLYCIILFVSFINNVSHDIQISNIVERIFVQTKKKIEKEENEQEEDYIKKNESSNNWISYNTKASGYLQNIATDTLVEIATNNNFQIRIEQYFGYFHSKGTPLFSINREVNERGVLKSVISCFIFYPGERIEDHTLYGLRQLSEIAVKALSPGINDPGTASTCLDYLSELLILRMNKNCNNNVRDKKNEIRIIFPVYKISELIDICILPILIYGKNDFFIMLKLSELLAKLAINDTRNELVKPLNKLAEAIISEAENSINNAYFRNYFFKKLKEIKEIKENYFNFSYPPIEKRRPISIINFKK